MKKRGFLIGVLFLFMFSWQTYLYAGGEQKVLTPEILESLHMVSEIKLSPGGDYIAYTVRVPRDDDEKPGPSHSVLYVYSIQSGTTRQFTHPPLDVHALEWSPNGKEISFLAKREAFDKHTQIYSLPVDGGEARKITKAPTDIRSFKWSPDGSLIAYTIRQQETDEEKQAKEKGEDWEFVDETYHHIQLWIFDVKSGESFQLQTGDRTVLSYTWSPDSSQIIFEAVPTTHVDDSYMFRDIYIIDVAKDKKAQLLVDWEGKLGPVAWSPDGKRLAWNGAVDIYDPSAGSVFMCELPECKPENLTGDSEETVQWVDWLDPDTLIIRSIEGEHTVLKTMDIQSRKVTYFIGPEENANITSVSFEHGVQPLALRIDRYNHPPELYIFYREKRQLKRLTHLNPVLDDIPFQPWEVISYNARDGMVIRGLLLKPLHYKKGKKYPLIIQIHGGPESAYTVGWQTYYIRWSHLLSHRGYMVFAPNYRGSTGRGVAFAKADHRDLGNKEFLDVLDGIRALADMGLVDENRVGMGGGSYGGYFSALAATRYAEYFKAAIDFAGISNQLSKVGTGDIPWEMSYVHFDLPPAGAHPKVGLYFESEHRMKLLEWSPLWYIENALKHPVALLIAHGKEDTRVPVTQAWELYRALKMGGHPKLRFVLYPREGHGLRERAHRLHFAETSLEWFDTYVKGK